MSLDYVPEASDELLLRWLLRRARLADASGSIPRNKSAETVILAAKSAEAANLCPGCNRRFDRLQVYITADRTSPFFDDIGSIWLTNAINRVGTGAKPYVNIIAVAESSK
jgi:hypothetical protein